MNNLFQAGVEEQMIERATPFAFTPDCSLITAAAEDLVVLKAFANRDRDWGDVETVILLKHRTIFGKII
jgi:hypothetical protein